MLFFGLLAVPTKMGLQKLQRLKNIGLFKYTRELEPRGRVVEVPEGEHKLNKTFHSQHVDT